MHLLPTQTRSLDEEVQAIDLDQSPAEVLVLSFTDSDLAVVATAWELGAGALPSLRLANISKLKHPYSVDLLIETLASKTRFVLVRLLGGADYWRYGVDELALAARLHGFHLAVLPGDRCGDARLEAASTVCADDLGTLWDYFQAGGVGNIGQALRFIALRLGHPYDCEPPRAVPGAGLHRPACRPGGIDSPHALILFYRSVLLAADTAPIAALSEALAARGARVSAFFVTSLKDAESAHLLGTFLDAEKPDVILNTTAFSARDAAGCITDRADAPVFQVILSGSDRENWTDSARGLGAADLAMNVVLPEVDGRIITGAISFKAEAGRRPDLEFTRIVHRPDPDNVARVVDRALGWARLRRMPRGERRLACVLSDYPGKDGRAGYAVGLDSQASVVAIADHLRAAGFAIGGLPDAAALMTQLTKGAPAIVMSLPDYRRAFAALPQAFTALVEAAWGNAADDEACGDGLFRFRVVRAGGLLVAVQPDRGSRANRRADAHDAALPPRHGYIAFYLWLRHVERCHAMIHLGTHGTLEWLSGKAVALSTACAPEVLTGSMPVIYPFIVNNPGEAAQAKRRIGAVIIGHLTPPLIEAGTHGDTAELEQLFDEYAEALALDPRRARLLAKAILTKATDTGMLRPSDQGAQRDPNEELVALDAWLCDLKEMRIGDGLHVFGERPDTDRHRLTVDNLAIGSNAADVAARLDACGEAELNNLVASLDGRFVPPGPAGAPTRGRLDVLPTGRNLYTVDPRAVPTRTAWEIGLRMADDLATRYAQDHGDWPRRVVLDLWGSATMRTGGDDLAQAFALIGAKPRWDHGSTRVNGFDITPLAKLGRARIDVTLRISGLFRDTFPDQIALFDAAVRAIATLDEENAENPLAEAHRDGADLARLFGAAPGAYGIGIARTLADDAWAERADLGQAYLAATSHAFGRNGAGEHAADRFRDCVARADAFSHAGDLPGQDVLESDVIAEHEGGFAAAAALLGAAPALYHVDTTRPERLHLRSLTDEITRALRARATNPRWIAGQMRHGHRGAIAIAETLDALFAYAATTDAVPSGHFDLYFDATLGNETVRAFLERENPAAATSMARKFESAIRRELWTSRRNSTTAVLADIARRSKADRDIVAASGEKTCPSP